MILRELVHAQNIYADDFCKFIVNDEKLTRENIKKYRNCYVISWEVSRNTDGFSTMYVIVEV